MSTQNKIRANRSRYTITYGYVRTPPDYRTIAGLDGQEKTIDVNRFVYNRDYYLVPGTTIPGDSAIANNGTAEYDEALITLNYEDTKTINFNITFSSTPIATLEIYPANSDNYIPYILSITTSSMTIGVSAPTSGTLIYKAINLTSGMFPVLITRNTLFPSIQTIATAGRISMNNQIQTDVAYSELAAVMSGIPELIITTQDNGSLTADTGISYDEIGVADTIINMSSEFSGSLNYIALRP